MKVEVQFIPNIYEDTISKSKRKNSSKAEIIKQAKIIVIVMIFKQILECLDRSLRYICDILTEILDTFFQL